MNLMELVIAGIMFVVLGFTLSIGQTILTQLSTTQTANSYAANTTAYAQSGVNTLSYWLPIIALAMAAGFVIAILITYLLGSVVGKQSASV
jgi:hypothetical protein